MTTSTNTPSTPTVQSVLAADMQEFIRLHRTDDVRTLALRAPRNATFDLTLALEQIAGWQTARRKLPKWAECEGLIYPPHLSMEQCSSEATARYKAAVAARLIGVGVGDAASATSMADLTGGFGVDFSFLAPLFGSATYVERNPRLCEVARHNMPLLGLESAEVVCAEAEERLATMSPVTMLFLDPARRDSHGGKTVAMVDCSPDVSALRQLLLQKAQVVMVKLSPMLDWHKAVADMCGSVAEVHIVGTGGECKELLLVADGACHESVEVTCWSDGRVFCFTADGTDTVLPPIAEAAVLMGCGADAQLCLCEPDATLMKAGCFGLVASRYGLRAVGRNSHLFVGADPGASFPGRRFRLVACTSMNRRSLKVALAGVDRASVAVRNMPLSPDALRRKLGLKDGGDTYVFGTTLADGTHAVMVCKRF